jgi:hypothetical protein
MPMRIGILPHADLPHLIPSFRIGRALLKWGHTVHIFGSDVQTVGRGHSDAWRGLLETFGLSGRQVIHGRRDVTVSDWLIGQMRERQLDAIILDAVWQGLAFGIDASGAVRSVVIHHAGLPDFRGGDMPTWAFVHPAHSRDYWAQARRAVEQVEQSGRGVRGLLLSAKALSAAGRAAADAFDFGCTEFAALPAIRAMSLCPAAEFPRERGRVDYFGTLLPGPGDVDWRPLPAELADGSRDLIACVFGTTGLNTREEYEWLAALAQGLAHAFPRDQIVVVIPEWANSPPLIHDRPPNLLSYPWIPLWELLSTRKGARVLVTTPGVGAFREAVASGTPIVAIPRATDQFGVAARVEYFKLGSALVSRELPRPDLVVSHVARVLEDPDIRIQAQRLGQEFTAFDATLPLKRFIENPVQGASHVP